MGIVQTAVRSAERDRADRSLPFPRAITVRALLIGILLIVADCYWVTLVEVRWYTLDGNQLPLFVTPIFLLFALTIVNNLPAGVRRFQSKTESSSNGGSPDEKRTFLSQGELLVIYIMVVMSCTLSGHDMLQNLLGSIGHAHRFATPENQWEKLFFPSLQTGLLLTDPDAIRDFYNGGSSIYSLQAIRPWIGPLSAWAGIVLVMVFIMLCLNVVLRKQWTEFEKLSFPLIQLPLELTRNVMGADGLFRKNLFWLGFGIATFIDFVNGMQALYPSWPYFTYVKLWDVAPYFTERPWSAIGATRISMYPFMIGLGFFLPADLSFSCWFFYLVGKAQRVVGTQLGMDQVRGFPFFNEQSSGAWIALAVLAIWGARHAISEAWKSAVGISRDSSPERIENRVAFLGLIVGSMALLGALMWSGMSWWVAALYMLIFYLLSVAITHVRAELGTPHEINFVSPQRIILAFTGGKRLGTQNLTALQTYFWMNRGYRCHPMPGQLEALKMAERTHIPVGKLVGVMLLAIFVGLIATYWANLDIGYRDGSLTKCIGFKMWVGQESFANLTTWLNAPPPVNARQLSWMGGGFGLVIGLSMLRFRFPWLPFHPAGFGLAVSYAMEYFWFAFFVSWVIKVGVTRYGGMSNHRRLIPLMLGLVAGDYVCGSIWSLIGAMLGKETYKIFI